MKTHPGDPSVTRSTPHARFATSTLASQPQSSSPSEPGRPCHFAAPLLGPAGGAFAGLGLLLASLGIFGVVSYPVTRQMQEIGIRMALGASRSRVQLDVLLRTLQLSLIGIGIGVVASIAVARLIASLLFHTA